MNIKVKVLKGQEAVSFIDKEYDTPLDGDKVSSDKVDGIERKLRVTATV